MQKMFQIPFAVLFRSKIQVLTAKSIFYIFDARH